MEPGGAAPGWAETIIDAHIHLRHGDKEHSEYTPEEIVRVMDSAGIKRGVVFAMSCSTKRSIEMGRRAATLFPDRLIPFAYALPSAGKAIVPEMEEAISEFGFRGIKIHRGESSLEEDVMGPVLGLATERQVPCLVDFMGRHGDLERMAEAFPETCIIAAHLGQYLCRDPKIVDRFIELAGLFPNVYLDTSGVVLRGKVREAVRALGASRVIFGSDGPGPKEDPAARVREALELVRSEGLTGQTEPLVLGGNIARLLGL